MFRKAATSTRHPIITIYRKGHIRLENNTITLGWSHWTLVFSSTFVTVRQLCFAERWSVLNYRRNLLQGLQFIHGLSRNGHGQGNVTIFVSIKWSLFLMFVRSAWIVGASHSIVSSVNFASSLRSLLHHFKISSSTSLQVTLPRSSPLIIQNISDLTF